MKSKSSSTHSNSSNCDIAIIGIGCNYPGAKSPLQLWENILSRKQQFREMPDCRLPISDYYDPDPLVADKSYQKKAALLDGYKFDWLNHKIPKSTFESTDIVHWLALDTALQALADTGISIDSESKEKFGCVIGNTLTGEFTRSNNMMLRWPYVRKAMRASLQAKGLIHLADSLEDTMEQYYKSVFAPVNEDSLAGGLANTIAGRVCNYLDIHGGGFIVDGACSSSLLSICTAANYLELRQMDLVIAGGVDVSLDTFELIGFAKTGALTRDEMRVYDKNGKGFIPGEGSGMVVMKRLDDAIRDKNQIYAVLKGWGISSDGKGGITAPSAIGQSKALLRAYEKANFDPELLNFIEGHGTGTTVGDKIELEGISIALNNRKTIPFRNCGVTSFKSIVGHTKAAAGVGAFIKTVMALNRRVIPPTAGLQELNPIFNDKAKSIYPVLQGEVMDEKSTMYAGVSAMGFGGINSHVILKSGDAPFAKIQPPMAEKKLLVSNQTHELFIFAGKDEASLKSMINEALVLSKGMSYAEMADFANFNNSKVDFAGTYRASIVASYPFEVERKLNELLKLLDTHTQGTYYSAEGNSITIGKKKNNLRLGALYPGQGSQRINMAYKLVQRYDWAKDLLEKANGLFKLEGTDNVLDSIFRPTDKLIDIEQDKAWKNALKQTDIAQPAITVASLIWHKYLEKLGVKINATTGHSLGELMAFHAAGLISEETLLSFAAFRGKAMAHCGSGTMASLVCDKETAEKYIKNAPGYAAIANLNSPEQTVISGQEESIDHIIKAAQADHITAVKLSVSAAFHSKLIEDTAHQIETFKPLQAKLNNRSTTQLISSISGNKIGLETDLNSYFSQQCIKQVNFIDTINSIKNECDILIEIGPGKILTGLSESIQTEVKCFPVEIKANEDQSLNIMLANVFVMGADLNIRELYADRFIQDFIPASEKEFIVNPCERPFPEIMVSNTPTSSEALNNNFLANHLDLSIDKYNEYMHLRGDFIKEMMQTDMKYLSKTGPALFNYQSVTQSIKAETAAPKQMPVVATPSFHANVNQVLYSKIELITGFPSASFTGNMKLLDDFNLDSIKAGSLLNGIFKDLQIQGLLNSANFLNASLDAIIGEIEKASPKLVQSITQAPSVNAGVKQLLYKKIETITGFPSANFAGNMKLLDDFNLDSIKAGSLLNAMFKELQIQGKLNAAGFLNASLDTIIDEIEKLTITTRVSTVEATPINNKTAIQQVVFKLIEEKTGFPQSAIKPEFKLLDDLNLDSIKAGVFIASLLKNYDLQGKLEPSKFANASLTEIVDKLASLLTSTTTPVANQVVNNLVDNKVNSYSVSLITDNISLDEISMKQYWINKKVALVCTQSNFDYATALQQQIANYATCTVINYHELANAHDDYQVILSVLPNSKSPDELMEVTKLLTEVANLDYGHLSEIGFVQFGDGLFAKGQEKSQIPVFSAAAFSASLHLERPSIKIRTVEVDQLIDVDTIGKVVLNEFLSPQNHLSAGYDSTLQRRTMAYQQTSEVVVGKKEILIANNDVVVVTGGAKGITSECAFEFAKKHHCKMALIGSSAYNGQEGEIKSILEKYASEGLTAKYYACNIVNQASVSDVFNHIASDLGQITVIVHGAGKNVPRRTETVNHQQVIDEISPKLIGAYNLVNATNFGQLKYFIAFTSIIGVTGMAGNSWYAFSNEALDLLLRDIKQKHGIETVSLAYSVWSELGMGERMGSTAALARMGIGSINPTDGINQFLNWTEFSSSDQQIVISAGMGNLDTWIRKPYDLPKASRYLQKVLQNEPGVQVKVRATLSQLTDVYIDDHNYKGSLLFPTVFGLEAMAQAVSLVTGIHDFASVRLENVSLQRPIVVPQNGETEIQIKATVVESNNKLSKVEVGISTEHSNYTDNHFSATFFVSAESELSKKFEITVKEPLPIDPENDLYSWLLFQGPRFQNINKVYETNDSFAIFSTKQLESDSSNICFSADMQKPLLLGSPVLRDTLLQSVQLILTKQIVLPISIDSWQMYQPKNQPMGGKVRCQLSSWDQNIGRCSVVMVNEANEVIEEISGYTVKAMDAKPYFPDALELNDFGAMVQKRIVDGLASHQHLLGEKNEMLVYKHSINFHQMSKTERHELEQELFKKFTANLNNQSLVDASISWMLDGKPTIDDNEYDISISHSLSTLIMTLGKTSQGVDIEMVPNKQPDEWKGMLEKSITRDYDKLSALDKDINQCYTRLWGTQEVCIKALGAIPQSVSVKLNNGTGIILEAIHDNKASHILTYPVELFPGVVYMVALMVNLKPEMPKIYPAINVTSVDDIFDPKTEKFVTNFHTAFKDCNGFFGKTYFTDFPLWMGSLRELILTPVKKQLLKDLGSGEFGMVTNDSKINIYGDADTLDKITGRLWITEKSDLKNSLIDLGYEWLKHTEDGQIVKIADCELSTTWVKIEERGIVKLSPIPDYFYQFLDDRLKRNNNHDENYPLATQLSKSDLGHVIYQSNTFPRPSIQLNKKVYETGIYNANTVGNLYYSNYYDWQAKNLESFLFKAMPELFFEIGRAGEYICLEANINHLQEAMPFEDIEVQMYIDHVYEKGLTLYFEFFAVSKESKRKLSYGHNTLLWAKRADETQEAKPEKLPAKILELMVELTTKSLVH